MSSKIFNADELNIDYYSSFLSSDEADDIFQNLCELPFESITFSINNKSYIPRRRVYAMGAAYYYGQVSPTPHPWLPFMDNLRQKVERATGYYYNECFINLYEDGSAGISPHKDNQSILCSDTPIACASFGATRKIVFTRQGFEERTMEPTHGSLYVMMPPTNQFWSHESPKDPAIKSPRISVTFRKIIEDASPSLHKKRRLNDISEGDRLEQNKPSNNYNQKEWTLDENFRVYISIRGSILRVVFKDCSNQQHVELTPICWSVFSRKIINSFYNYTDCSLNCNNQLIGFIVDRVLKLYQCFYSSVGKRFHLSSNYVNIPWETVEKLKKIIPDITRQVCRINMEQCLPELFKNIKCTEEIHISYEEAQDIFLTTIDQESLKIINTLFKYWSCEVEHGSQLKPDCVSIPPIEKFHRFKTDIFCRINFKSLMDTLKSKGCLCHYYMFLQNNSFDRLKIMLTEM